MNNPSGSATRAQAARVATNRGRLIDPDEITAMRLEVVPRLGDFRDLVGVVVGETYRLSIETHFEIEISRGEYLAIELPNDLQPLTPSHVSDWTKGMLAEYRRQYDAKMRLPQPPLIVHPDEVDRWWNAIHS